MRPAAPLPAKLTAYLRELGIDSENPTLSAAFLDGVKVAEEALVAEKRWMRAQCKPSALEASARRVR